MADKRILITGATGFLGRELVGDLLRAEPSAHLTLLIRERDDPGAAARGRDLLARSVGPGELDDALARTTFLRGDLEHERLGLSARSYEALTRETTEIIHGAASVSFDLPLTQARAINVDGTRRVLELAQAARARTDYIGTAYIAGQRTGLALESELDLGQGFRNTYERTKLEAERLVQERARHQPIAVFRPSIIVGDSSTGRTSSYKVMYWPLKMFSRGWGWLAAGRRATPIDLVPVDYVVKALLHIRRDPASAGRTYHLAAGPENTSTLGELCRLAGAFFGRRPPLFVPPVLFDALVRPFITLFIFGKFRRLWRTAYLYLPYLALDVQFDTSNARAALAGSGIALPRVDQYFERLLRFCVASDWGNRTVGEGQEPAL